MDAYTYKKYDTIKVTQRMVNEVSPGRMVPGKRWGIKKAHERAALVVSRFKDPSPDISQNIVNEIKEHIRKALPYIRRTKRFVRRIRKEIFILHDYNCKILKGCGIYPLTKSMRNLLIIYIELEMDLLSSNECSNSEYIPSVQQRIVQLLSMIYKEYSSQRDLNGNPNNQWKLMALLFEDLDNKIHEAADEIRRLLIKKIDMTKEDIVSSGRFVWDCNERPNQCGDSQEDKSDIESDEYEPHHCFGIFRQLNSSKNRISEKKVVKDLYLENRDCDKKEPKSVNHEANLNFNKKLMATIDITDKQPAMQSNYLEDQQTQVRNTKTLVSTKEGISLQKFAVSEPLDVSSVFAKNRTTSTESTLLINKNEHLGGKKDANQSPFNLLLQIESCKSNSAKKMTNNAVLEKSRYSEVQQGIDDFGQFGSLDSMQTKSVCRDLNADFISVIINQNDKLLSANTNIANQAGTSKNIPTKISNVPDKCTLLKEQICKEDANQATDTKSLSSATSLQSKILKSNLAKIIENDSNYEIPFGDLNRNMTDGSNKCVLRDEKGSSYENENTHMEKDLNEQNKTFLQNENQANTPDKVLQSGKPVPIVSVESTEGSYFLNTDKELTSQEESNQVATYYLARSVNNVSESIAGDGLTFSEVGVKESKESNSLPNELTDFENANQNDGIGNSLLIKSTDIDNMKQYDGLLSANTSIASQEGTFKNISTKISNVPDECALLKKKIDQVDSNQTTSSKSLCSATIANQEGISKNIPAKISKVPDECALLKEKIGQEDAYQATNTKILSSLSSLQLQILKSNSAKIIENDAISEILSGDLNIKMSNKCVLREKKDPGYVNDTMLQKINLHKINNTKVSKYLEKDLTSQEQSSQVTTYYLARSVNNSSESITVDGLPYSVVGVKESKESNNLPSESTDFVNMNQNDELVSANTSFANQEGTSKNIFTKISNVPDDCTLLKERICQEDANQARNKKGLFFATSIQSKILKPNLAKIIEDDANYEIPSKELNRKMTYGFNKCVLEDKKDTSHENDTMLQHNNLQESNKSGLSDLCNDNTKNNTKSTDSTLRVVKNEHLAGQEDANQSTKGLKYNAAKTIENDALLVKSRSSEVKQEIDDVPQFKRPNTTQKNLVSKQIDLSEEIISKDSKNVSNQHKTNLTTNINITSFPMLTVPIKLPKYVDTIFAKTHKNDKNTSIDNQKGTFKNITTSNRSLSNECIISKEKIAQENANQNTTNLSSTTSLALKILKSNLAEIIEDDVIENHKVLPRNFIRETTDGSKECVLRVEKDSIYKNVTMLQSTLDAYNVNNFRNHANIEIITEDTTLKLGDKNYLHEDPTVPNFNYGDKRTSDVQKLKVKVETITTESLKSEHFLSGKKNHFIASALTNIKDEPTPTTIRNSKTIIKALEPQYKNGSAWPLDMTYKNILNELQASTKSQNNRESCQKNRESDNVESHICQKLLIPASAPIDQEDYHYSLALDLTTANDGMNALACAAGQLEKLPVNNFYQQAQYDNTLIKHEDNTSKNDDSGRNLETKETLVDSYPNGCSKKSSLYKKKRLFSLNFTNKVNSIAEPTTSSSPEPKLPLGFTNFDRINTSDLKNNHKGAFTIANLLSNPRSKIIKPSDSAFTTKASLKCFEGYTQNHSKTPTAITEKSVEETLTRCTKNRTDNALDPADDNSLFNNCTAVLGYRQKLRSRSGNANPTKNKITVRTKSTKTNTGKEPATTIKSNKVKSEGSDKLSITPKEKYKFELKAQQLALSTIAKTNAAKNKIDKLVVPSAKIISQGDKKIETKNLKNKDTLAPTIEKLQKIIKEDISNNTPQYKKYKDNFFHSNIPVTTCDTIDVKNSIIKCISSFTLPNGTELTDSRLKMQANNNERVLKSKSTTKNEDKNEHVVIYKEKSAENPTIRSENIAQINSIGEELSKSQKVHKNNELKVTLVASSCIDFQCEKKDINNDKQITFAYTSENVSPILGSVAELTDLPPKSQEDSLQSKKGSVDKKSSLKTSALKSESQILGRNAKLEDKSAIKERFCESNSALVESQSPNKTLRNKKDGKLENGKQNVVTKVLINVSKIPEICAKITEDIHTHNQNAKKDELPNINSVNNTLKTISQSSENDAYLAGNTSQEGYSHKIGESAGELSKILTKKEYLISQNESEDNSCLKRNIKVESRKRMASPDNDLPLSKLIKQSQSLNYLTEPMKSEDVKLNFLSHDIVNQFTSPTLRNIDTIENLNIRPLNTITSLSTPAVDNKKLASNLATEEIYPRSNLDYNTDSNISSVKDSLFTCLQNVMHDDDRRSKAVNEITKNNHQIYIEPSDLQGKEKKDTNQNSASETHNLDHTMDQLIIGRLSKSDINADNDFAVDNLLKISKTNSLNNSPCESLNENSNSPFGFNMDLAWSSWENTSRDGMETLEDATTVLQSESEFQPFEKLSTVPVDLLEPDQTDVDANNELDDEKEPSNDLEINNKLPETNDNSSAKGSVTKVIHMTGLTQSFNNKFLQHKHILSIPLKREHESISKLHQTRTTRFSRDDFKVYEVPPLAQLNNAPKEFSFRGTSVTTFLSNSQVEIGNIAPKNDEIFNTDTKSTNVVTPLQRPEHMAFVRPTTLSEAHDELNTDMNLTKNVNNQKRQLEADEEKMLDSSSTVPFTSKNDNLKVLRPVMAVAPTVQKTKVCLIQHQHRNNFEDSQTAIDNSSRQRDPRTNKRRPPQRRYNQLPSNHNSRRELAVHNVRPRYVRRKRDEQSSYDSSTGREGARSSNSNSTFLGHERGRSSSSGQNTGYHDSSSYGHGSGQRRSERGRSGSKQNLRYDDSSSFGDGSGQRSNERGRSGSKQNLSDVYHKGVGDVMRSWGLDSEAPPKFGPFIKIKGDEGSSAKPPKGSK